MDFAEGLMTDGVIKELIPLFESAKGSSVVLTPNRRLGRFLQSQYALFMQLQSKQAWPTLPCFHLEGWLQSQWTSLQQRCFPGTDRVLLDPVQESIIWEQVIRDHSEGHELLNTRQAAGVAMEAWHKTVQWRLDEEPVSSKTPFKLWSKVYLDHCQSKKIIDRSQIIGILKRAVEESFVWLPKGIAVYDLDVISPLIRDLLESFSAQGVDVFPVSIKKQGNVRRITLADEDEEIKTAARWAAGLVAGSRDKAALRIGIVVPQLTRLRSRVNRIFNSVFEPQGLQVDEPRRVPAINISAAQPLSDTPPVRAALDALRLNDRSLDMEQVSHVLRSPFIGGFNELNRRALLDVALRAEYITMDAGQLRSAAAMTVNKDTARREFICPDLHRRLQAFHQFSSTGRSAARYPGEWAGVFTQQLSLLGWPGNRKLDPLEHQQISHWQEVLWSLAGLDTITGRCDAGTALAHLNNLAYQYPFHARTSSSPVQILGLLEAAGMLFDHVWVMNMDSQAWPMSPSPNPLLSIRKQVELKMPNASVEVELEYARTMTERLAGSAGNVIFSHSNFRDGQALATSPLIEDCEVMPAEQLHTIEDINYPEELYRCRGLEQVPDDHGPGITDPASIRGGTQILKDQAACPFRSFAKHRLHADPIEQVLPGISPLQHGRLMHKALELAWGKLEDQAALLQLNEAGLKSLIHDAVSESFTELSGYSLPGNRLLELQSERMRGLLETWLSLEKQRTPFTIAFSENTRDIDIAKLPMQVRYDRIDRLQDGSYFVIDYKTGLADIKYWAGDRPDEPQVPVYCIANKNISGAAFGVLNAREVGFKGIAESKETAPGLKEPETLARMDLPDNWQAIMDQWQTVLEQLAQQFIEGQAQVDPKNLNTTCRYCALPGLCRINEYAAGITSTGAEDE